MATVGELSDPYAHFLRTPPPPGTQGVCEICLTFIGDDWTRCYPCAHQSNAIRALLPISMSPHFGQLHTSLVSYKGRAGLPPSARIALQLSAVLWRFIAAHETCLARASGIHEQFDLVTTVPSSSRERDASHPLSRMLGETVGVTKDRYAWLLERSGVEVEPRTVTVDKYDSTRTLNGETVLLIDDTWVTGAAVQSAAQLLLACGASAVGSIVIGRHVKPEYRDNEARLAALPQFDWSTCALEP